MIVTTDIFQIEENISLLSRENQLWLVERIIHRLRQEDETEKSDLENQLEAMAADEDIQRELHKINEEFLETEVDGLGIV